MGKALAGRVAVVTGGTRGIGRAVAERLLEEGASVAICGASQASVNNAARELTTRYGDAVLVESADVANSDDVLRFFNKVALGFGRLDVLVNNAGVGVFGSTADLTPENWRRVVEINLNGAFYCSHEAIPKMRQSGGGYIINISSLAGKNPFAGGAAYNASKFGLNGFSEAMMLDHRHDGVRVSYIMPGSVDTEFSPRSGRASWKIAPEDIAEIVMLLLKMPERTLVSRVEVRPTRPPQK
jgi:NAD(P)-dependent dehydrogenase (short-subunit alcohol dehydrogenase family)